MVTFNLRAIGSAENAVLRPLLNLARRKKEEMEKERAVGKGERVTGIAQNVTIYSSCVIQGAGNAQHHLLL